MTPEEKYQEAIDTHWRAEKEKIEKAKATVEAEKKGMIQRTEVEQYFLDNVHEALGFARRTDGKIERAVSREHEPNKITVSGEYYANVEIMTDTVFLDYIDDLIVFEYNYRKNRKESVD